MPIQPSRGEILNLQKKIRENPVWFQEYFLKRNLWSKEREIAESVRDYKETSVKSCNASGKTFSAAGIVHWFLMGFPNSIVLTTAPTGRQVKEVLWREIRAAVAGKPYYPKDRVLDTKIDISDRWFALGLSTDTPDQFQGFHAQYLLVITDEASGVDDKISEAIDGLKPYRRLNLGNPLKNTGRFAKSFQEQGVNKISISAFDTPNVKENRIVIPGLITWDEINKFKQRYGEDSDVYRVRILGEFPKSEADSYYSIDDIYKAINREVANIEHWEKKTGVDVARFGDARTIITIRQDKKVIRKEAFSKKDTMEIVGRIIQIAKEEKVRDINIFVDSVGLGGGVVDRLKEQGWMVNAVNSGLPADNDKFANQRCEMADNVKEWLKTGQLPKDDDYYEMANVKYKFNSKGQLILESKDDMKKRGLPSPDTFDSLCLTFAKRDGGGAMYSTQQSGGIEPLYPGMPG